MKNLQNLIKKCEKKPKDHVSIIMKRKIIVN